MTGIPRVPRDIDPRRPPNRDQDNEQSSGKPARSYGQSAEVPKSDRRDRDEIEEFEDLTEEPVREGNDTPAEGSAPSQNKKKRELREFEELAGEPVLDEDEKKPGS